MISVNVIRVIVASTHTSDKLITMRSTYGTQTSIIDGDIRSSPNEVELMEEKLDARTPGM